jgi:pimeloyl-ACP methyl ester carboxylesterase
MYDEIPPPCAATLHRGIPDSRFVMFYNSAHVAHLEEQERYNRVLRAFLAQAEGE